MEHKQSANEFVARIDGRGNIAVPPELARRFAGKRVHVRLNNREVAAELKARNVTEEEVDRIADVQRESREQIVAFLLSEGALKANRGFHRRATRIRPGTRR